jgi:hypothetical protein
MPFITQGKTNWKFLLIVIILVVIIMGVIWILSLPIPPPWQPPPKADEKYCKRDTDCVSEMTIKKDCINTTTYQKIGSPVQYQMLPPLTCKCVNNRCTVAQDITADWKTFTNQRNEFEIKYPKDWQAKSYELPCAGCAAVYEFGPNRIQITVTESTNWDDAKTNLERNVDGKSEEIVIDGLSAIKREGKAKKYSAYTALEGTEIEGIILMRNYRIYYFFATKEDKETFNQMLSTFKFLE